MIFIKHLILIILSFFFRGLGDNGAVPMYHSIGDNKLFFTTTPKNFEFQMSYIKQKGYKVISLGQMVCKIKNKEPVGGFVSITFDDGYKDFMLNALPVLEKYKFPATVFVITGKLGESVNLKGSVAGLQMMSAEDIKKISLSNQLIDFMPHTRNHPDISKIDFKDAIEEIETSRRDIENITGKKANIFAYPKGKYTAEIRNHLKNSSDWLGAVTTLSGLVKSNCYSIFDLKRIAIDSKISFNVFKALLSYSIEIYNHLKSH